MYFYNETHFPLQAFTTNMLRSHASRDDRIDGFIWSNARFDCHIFGPVLTSKLPIGPRCSLLAVVPAVQWLDKASLVAERGFSSTTAVNLESFKFLGWQVMHAWLERAFFVQEEGMRKIFQEFLNATIVKIIQPDQAFNIPSFPQLWLLQNPLCSQKWMWREITTLSNRAIFWTPK